MTSCPKSARTIVAEAPAQPETLNIPKEMSIPNLNTLRSARGGPRLRARRGPRDASGGNDGGYGAGHEEEDIARSRDRIIQQTDHDASSSRMSAVKLGYYNDEFAKDFFPLGEEVPKRYPIINRGTYVRTKAIDKLVTRFLDSTPHRKQIISLGAGSDTRFFRLCAGKHNVRYHEIDFESNVTPKRAAIRASEHLSRLTIEDESKGSIYHLHALDLRQLTIKSPPILPELEADVPTMIISECCLCYLPPDITTSVIQYFTMHIEGALALAIYEPIRPFDAFGKTMVTNLASRGIELRTLKRYYSLDAQRQRLRLSGFHNGQGARDVYQLWESDEWTSKAERERIDKIEWLDEIEEWKLLAKHYCVAWGWRGAPFEEAWKDLKGDGTVDELQDENIG